MRQYIRVLILALVGILTLNQFVCAQTVVASRAILVAVGEEIPLFSKNATVRHPVASLTKVLTAVLAIESGRLDEEVTISATAPYAGGSSLYIKTGEVYSLRDLLYAAMLVSANDATAAIAEHLGGSISGFAEMMNERASNLGMANSQFKNPHGMPENGHYSTAEDISILGVHAASLPLYLEIASTKQYTLGDGRAVTNQNKLLDTPGVRAGKTGYTDEAGQCLLTIADRDGLMLVSVILGSQGQAMWTDTRSLLDFGFSNYTRRILVRDKQTVGVTRIPLAGEILLIAKGDVSRVYKTSEQLSLSTEVKVTNRLLPPLRPGQEVGEIIIRNAGIEVARAALTVPVYIPLVTTPRIIGILCIVAFLGGAIIFKRRRRS
ncbi:MAG: D-alanyl-D-alanine carboxypeptidase family protein [Bacillota bacterium]|nr:D-alanyl-D-alanine carboxypeptidase family protein [Bacillota bacterium]